VSKWNEKYDRYVGHYSMYQEKVDKDSIPLSKIFVADSDIGRKVDFKRVAPHHIVLSPHCRTSSPHAESLEEEFVFVLKGNPHLWLNGYLYELREGHAVGFPAGTGIAHTLINNSDAEVHLLVIGERTKSDNLCSFPVNPELKEGCKIWWGNPPKHELGPHAGLPGAVTSSDLGPLPPECLVYCPREPRRKPFHYPGDSESFGEGFRISDKVGLKALGIWYERLPPGKRSAFPHAHTHEEEFVFVIEGKPTIWLDGFAKQVEAGYFAAFPSNTGIAHVIINDTNEEVIYICVGESQDFPDEKITYPLNKLRQRECERKGWYWLDAPKLAQGNASAISAADMSDHIAFRLCDESSAEEVLKIFQESPTYFQRVDGCPSTLATTKHAIIDGPKKRDEKYFKEFLIIDLNNEPIGVLDLHANHPEVGVCYLGLLLIKEDCFRKGLGRRCYELAEDYVKRGLGCKEIRLGVSDANDVTKFWEKQGFSHNGNIYNWTGNVKTSEVRELKKVIL
jgi:uncharacterized cupin superfamily protein/GNAT superfamily N-acetyltransferase